MYYIIYFIFGIIFGSFLNVIIYRIPNNLSIVYPRSFCPKCKQNIPFYRNIPIISFILLKGKCNNCKKSISLLYPAVELLIGIVFVIGLSKYQIPESILFSGTPVKSVNPVSACINIS